MQAGAPLAEGAAEDRDALGTGGTQGALPGPSDRVLHPQCRGALRGAWLWLIYLFLLQSVQI